MEVQRATWFELSDEQVAGMPPAQRRKLLERLERLERPVVELFPSRGALERIRPLRLGLMICGSVGLVP